jgi:hypothetical protein
MKESNESEAALGQGPGRRRARDRLARWLRGRSTEYFAKIASSGQYAVGVRNPNFMHTNVLEIT